MALKDCRVSHPKLASRAEINLPERFSVFSFSDDHRVRIRSINGLERLNKELKRRARLATLFPNPDSCQRLVSALQPWLSWQITPCALTTAIVATSLG